MSRPEATRSATVAKALSLLDLLASTGQELSVTELSRRLGVNKSTVCRLLNTLGDYGYIRKNPQTGQYLLGVRLLDLSTTLLKQLGLVDVAKPHLQRLASETGETVNLAILDGDRCLYVCAIEGRHAIRMVSHVGSRDYLHTTSVGKAILAHLPRHEVEAIVRRTGLPRRTPNSIADEEALFNHLEQVRRQGYALDNAENEEGCRCVGAPCFDRTGRPIAAVSVAGPSFRFREDRVPKLAKSVVATARAITEELQAKKV